MMTTAHLIVAPLWIAAGWTIGGAAGLVLAPVLLVGSFANSLDDRPGDPGSAPHEAGRPVAGCKVRIDYADLLDDEGQETQNFAPNVWPLLGIRGIP